MKQGDFELEQMCEIWGPDGVIEVGPDRDGLHLLEIRAKERREGKYEIVARITMMPEQAYLVMHALQKLTTNRSG